jgi:hypothetical protein
MASVWWWFIDGSGGCGCGGSGSFIDCAGSGSGSSDSAGNASRTDSSVQIVACKASVDSNVTSHTTNFINQHGYALDISALTQTSIGVVSGTSNSDRTTNLSVGIVDVNVLSPA